MECDAPAMRSSSSREPPANIKTTLAECRSGIASTTTRAPPGNRCTGGDVCMGTVSIRTGLSRPALTQSAERSVQRHGDEVRRHPIRDRVQGFAQVAAHVRRRVHLIELQAVTNRLRYLGRRE